MSEYEVFCQKCNVSFPVGTRVCMHCGGRTGPRPAQSQKTSLRERDAPLAEFFPVLPGERPQPVGEESEESAGDEVGRSPARIVMGVVWVLLAIIGSVYRVCTGG